MISLARRDGRPLRIGHRGAAALAPENTLRSFRAARDAGVDLIEFDVLDLRGGELVVAHSDDLYEVSHGVARGSVRERALENLRDVCPDLPTLDDALRFFAEDAPGTGVHLDLKTTSTARAVASALARFDLVERSFVSSFHRRALLEFAQVEPRVPVGISFPQDRVGIYGRRGSGLAVIGGLRALRIVTPWLAAALLARSGANALVLHHALVSRATVGRAHDRGASVVAWTVDDPRDLARVDTAGVDAVVTNDPTIFLSTLQT